MIADFFFVVLKARFNIIKPYSVAHLKPHTKWYEQSLGTINRRNEERTSLFQAIISLVHYLLQWAKWRGSNPTDLFTILEPPHQGDQRIFQTSLSQSWSFKIRSTTFLNYIKFFDPRTLKLKNLERARHTCTASLSFCRPTLSPQFSKPHLHHTQHQEICVSFVIQERRAADCEVPKLRKVWSKPDILYNTFEASIAWCQAIREQRRFYIKSQETVCFFYLKKKITILYNSWETTSLKPENQSMLRVLPIL